VPLVQVVDGRRQPERAQRAGAAYPQDELLTDPVLAVAPVQDVGDRTGGGCVRCDVGVEQVQRRAAHVASPDSEARRLARELDLDEHRAALVVLLERQPELLGIELRVALLLPSVGDRLAEVPEPVEEPDADERNAEIARRLQVVAGEDAETARVDGEARVDAELRREVGDEEAVVAMGALPPGRGALRAGWCIGRCHPATK
jgi:hypothetical protein